MDGELLVSKRPIVIVDTNMLMLMAEGVPVIDWIEELIDTKPVILCPEGVVRELESLKERVGVLGKKASFAHELARRYCERREGYGSSSVDKEIIALAVQEKEKGNTVIVATSDRNLRRTLREIGISTIFYRESQNKLEIERTPLI